MKKLLLFIFLTGLVVFVYGDDSDNGFKRYEGRWLLLDASEYTNYVDSNGDYLHIFMDNGVYRFEFKYTRGYTADGDGVQRGVLINEDEGVYIKCTNGDLYKISNVESVSEVRNNAISVDMDDFLLGWFQREEIIKKLRSEN
jgi:hypothetical protein